LQFEQKRPRFDIECLLFIRGQIFKKFIAGSNRKSFSFSRHKKNFSPPKKKSLFSFIVQSNSSFTAETVARRVRCKNNMNDSVMALVEQLQPSRA
jgi:hypothetical protein